MAACETQIFRMLVPRAAILGQRRGSRALAASQSRTQSPRAFCSAGERPERLWDNQSRTQSPRAFWSAGERSERLWDNGLHFPQSRTQSPWAFWPAGERPARLWDN